MGNLLGDRTRPTKKTSPPPEADPEETRRSAPLKAQKQDDPPWEETAEEQVRSSALINKFRPKTLDEVIGQDPIVKSLRSAVKNRTGQGFLFTGPSGTGKTTLSYIVAAMMGCREADITDVDAATYTGIDDMRALTAGLMYRPLGVGNAKALIVDECFIAGTLVQTPSGWQAIEHLAVGDAVVTCKGLGKIKKTLRKTVNAGRLISVSGGALAQTVVCTVEHPFLTTNGWVRAEDLHGHLPASVLFGNEIPEQLLNMWDEVYEQQRWLSLLRQLLFQNLCGVWTNFLGKSKCISLLARLRGQSCWPQPSWEKAFEGTAGASFSSSTEKQDAVSGTLAGCEQAGFQAHACFEQEPYRSRKGAANKIDERNSPRVPDRTGRQWSGSDQAPTTLTVLGWWFYGVCNSLRSRSEAWRLALLLQSRFRLSETTFSGRIGWPQSSKPGVTAKGSFERSKVASFRVEGASVFKRGGFARCFSRGGASSKYVSVYDLEIEGHCSYNVQGALVHNCHALSKQAWQSLLKSLEKPPPWVYWFLCTTEPTKVPAAAVTRCLRYELKPVANKALGELYDQVIAAEKLDVPGDVGDLIIKEAHGSPRQLLSNIGVCSSAENRKEAAALLLTASEEPAAIDLARALYKGNREWMELKTLIFALRGRSAESVRHVVRAYGEKIIESGKSEDQDGPHMEVLSAFRQPFNDGNGLTDLLDTVAGLSTLAGS